MKPNDYRYHLLEVIRSIDPDALYHFNWLDSTDDKPWRIGQYHLTMARARGQLICEPPTDRIIKGSNLLAWLKTVYRKHHQYRSLSPGRDRGRQ